MNPIKRLALAALSGAMCGALSYPLPSSAATANVTIGDDFFNPTSTTIKVSDQVTWTWTGSATHSTTANSGLWNSPQQTSGTFSHTFTSTGNFPYFCQVHTFMTASVTVQAANTPPTVTITNPANGTVLSAPATFTLAAKASDTNGTVSSVQFLQGATSLGTRTALPYSMMVSNLAAGNYNLSAVATDSNGLKATNAISISVVTPSPIVLSSVSRPSASAFQFSYTANPGLKYLVHRSAGLTNFTPIATNTAVSNSVTFRDNAATGDLNLYRVQLMPNP
jgi:chitinase